MSFRGTLDYSYSDLVAMFNQKKEMAYIDAYYSDAYALEKLKAKLSSVTNYYYVKD